MEDGGFILSETDYLQTSFSAFQDMRENGEYTDVTVRCKTRSFPAHRLVLAARIPHFRKILTRQESEVALNEIHPDAMESIINFAYEGKLKVTAENVYPMLLASGYLQLDRVHKACWEFLGKNPDSDGEHSTTVKLLPSDTNIRKNFDAFSSTEEFLFLPYSVLKELLSRNDLKVRNEAKVFEALIRWVKVSHAERKHLLPYLLTEIRMANLTPDYLVEEVATEELIQTSDQCKHIVEEAKSYHLLPRKRSMFFSFKKDPRLYTDTHENASCSNTAALDDVASENAMSTPLKQSTSRDDTLSTALKQSASRDNTMSTPLKQSTSRDDTLSTALKQSASPDNTTSTALKQGASRDNTASTALKKSATRDNTMSTATNQNASGDNTNKGALYRVCSFNGLGSLVSYYDNENKKWDYYPSSTHGEDVVGAVFVDGKIHVFFTNSVGTFELETRGWSPMEPIPVTIKGSGIVVHMNTIYIFGGFCFPNTIRRFDPQQKKWLQDEEMNIGRRNMSVTSYLGKYICLAGGFTTSCCSSVQKYNSVTKVWSEMPSMLCDRMDHDCASLNGKLYVCGGRNDHTRFLNTAEVYDRQTNSWTWISSTRVPRHSLSLVSRDGKLFAFGGTTEKETCTRGSETYCPETDRWTANIPVPVQGKCPTIIKAVAVDPCSD